jgi:hypothetical protein
MVKHKHHIIPVHAGGTNSPDNLIELTVAEHAEAHKILFEKYGRWQDEVAWRGLSGQIATAEINRIKNSERQKGEKNHMFGKPGPMRGKKHTDETKEKIKRARKKQVIKHSDETKKKIGDKHRGKITPDHVKKAVSESNKRRTGTKHKPHKNKGVKQKIICCPHCNKEGGTTMYRWHFNNCKLKINDK